MKQWWKSRTNWFNTIMGILVLMSSPEVLAVLPEEWRIYLIAATFVGHYVMRSITKTAVTLK